MAKQHFRTIFLLILFCMSIGFTESESFASDDKIAEIKPCVQISHPPQINFTGATGYYPMDPVTIKATLGKGTYQVKILAEPFKYTGQEHGEYFLETKYWINDEKNRVEPGKPYLIHIANSDLRKGKVREFQCVLYGGVTIQSISAQPAGEYKGEVAVTLIRLQ